MLGGHIIQAQQYHGGPQGQQASVKNYPNGNNNQISGITVIKENNIVMSGNIAHGMMSNS
jgi:hypothetical protein